MIVKEDNIPPLQWITGRITAASKGNDGLIRDATVKTNMGEYKRCLKKLCPFPIRYTTVGNCAYGARDRY